MRRGAIPVLLGILASACAHGAELDVEIRGIEGELLQNARAALDLVSYEERDPSPAQIRLMHQSAPEQIRTALQPYGYYHAIVRSELEQHAEGRYRASFEVDPGEPVIATEVRVAVQGRGGDIPEVQAALRQFEPREGEQFRARAYEDSKESVSARLRAAGFVDAQLIEHRVAVTLAENSADIDVIWESGERYRFGAVRFSESVFDEAFLQRYVPWRRGDPLARQPNVRWDLQARASSFNPGAFLSDWPGNLRFDLDTHGAFTDAGPRGELQLQNLEGELRGRPISGSADLTLTTEPALSGRLEVRSGASHVQVTAKRGEAWDAAARFEIAALQNWLPRASGSVIGRFTARGDWPNLSIVGNARAEELQVGGASIDAARLNVQIEEPRAPSGSARLAIDGATVGGVNVSDAQLNHSGSIRQHTLRLQANSSVASVELRMEGSRTEAQSEDLWVETVRRLRIDPPDLEPLTLTEPAMLAFGPSWLNLSRMCLASSEARVCAEGEIDDGGTGAAATRVDAAVTATVPDIAAAGLLSANVANVQGRLQLDADVTGTLADPALQVQLHAEALSAEIPQLGLHLTDGVLNARSRGEDRIAVSGSVQSGNGRITVAGTATTDGEVNLVSARRSTAPGGGLQRNARRCAHLCRRVARRRGGRFARGADRRSTRHRHGDRGGRRTARVAGVHGR